MRTIAPGVHLLDAFPQYAVNTYLVGDVLVDSGTRRMHERILEQLFGRDVRAHVVTHAHPDHFGSSHEICTALDIPLWAGAADRQAIESGRAQLSDNLIGRALARMNVAAHPVARALVEGDEVADFTVLEVPGHTPGSIALWRESDRVLICGDVLMNQPRVAAPPKFLSVDPELNRQSMRRLAELDPRLVLFGHGKPARFGGERRLTVR